MYEVFENDSVFAVYNPIDGRAEDYFDTREEAEALAGDLNLKLAEKFADALENDCVD